MTIDEMKKRKIELGYTNKDISEKSGVPVSTLQKIFSGTTAAPRAETLQALAKVFLTENSERSITPAFPETLHQSHFYDNENPYLSSGSAYTASHNAGRLHTIDDYMALPEECRVELIDGVFYDMASPVSVHQAIAGWIHSQFLSFVRQNKGICYPFIAPLDVQLDQDEYTVVQPDVMILCDRDKLKNGRIFGAPDFILEVLSPSTRKKDMSLKLEKYIQAGVREYWLLDPDKKQLLQHDLEHLSFPVIYGEESEVPVLVWDGKCKISLKDMYSEISFLY